MKHNPTPFAAAAMETKQSDGRSVRPEAYDEEVVVLVCEFVRGGKALPQRSACGTNHCLMLRLELVDEILQLFFWSG